MAATATVSVVYLDLTLTFYHPCRPANATPHSRQPSLSARRRRRCGSDSSNARAQSRPAMPRLQGSRPRTTKCCACNTSQSKSGKGVCVGGVCVWSGQPSPSHTVVLPALSWTATEIPCAASERRLTPCALTHRHKPSCSSHHHRHECPPPLPASLVPAQASVPALVREREREREQVSMHPCKRQAQQPEPRHLCMNFAAAPTASKCKPKRPLAMSLQCSSRAPRHARSRAWCLHPCLAQHQCQRQQVVLCQTVWKAPQQS